MTCAIRTCASNGTRTGANVAPTFCVGHAWLWVLRQDANETSSEFVERQECRGLLQGRTMRREVA